MGNSGFAAIAPAIKKRGQCRAFDDLERMECGRDGAADQVSVTGGVVRGVITMLPFSSLWVDEFSNCTAGLSAKPAPEVPLVLRLGLRLSLLQQQRMNQRCCLPLYHPQPEVMQCLA